MKKFLLTIALTLFAGQAWGGYYCVKATGSATKDNSIVVDSLSCTAADDSEAMSLATFNASTFAAGETVYFTAIGGDFTSTITIPSGGTAGSVISYLGLSDGPGAALATVTLSGNMINTNSKSNIVISGFNLKSTGANTGDNGVNLTAGSNITLSNLAIDMDDNGYGIISGGNMTNVTISDVSVIKPNVNRYTIYFFGASNNNISISSVSVSNAGSNGIWFRNTNGLSIDGLTISSGSILGIQLTNVSGVVTLENINAAMTGGVAVNMTSPVTGSAGSYLKNCTVTGSGVVGYHFGGVTGLIVTNCSKIGTGIPFRIDTGSHDLSFSNCSASDCTVSGNHFLVKGDAYNVTINDTTLTNTWGFLVTDTAHDITFNRCIADDGLSNGFWAKSTSNDITYNDCIAKNGDANGFHAEDGTSNLLYYRSKSYKNHSNGFATAIGAGPSPDIVIYDSCESSYNGVVNGTSEGGGFIPHDATTNVAIRYCIAHHNYNQGIGAVGSGTGVVYNNTNYANCQQSGTWLGWGGGEITSGCIRGNMYFALTGGGYVMKNNISGGGGLRERLDTGASYTEWDYNLYYPLDNSHFTNNGASDITWATYSASNEPHSMNTNPKLRSATDFRLQPSSPCINKGVNVGLTTDFLGHAISGIPDIGAYEFRGSRGGRFNFGNFDLRY